MHLLYFKLMSKGKILVADDEGINRLFLKSLLQNDGWAVDEAADGREAIDAAEGSLYNVILMDVNMPLIDGFQATRRIREKNILGRDGTEVVILALSAYNDEQFHQECRAAGMNGIVHKPITEKNLLRSVARYAAAKEE